MNSHLTDVENFLAVAAQGSFAAAAKALCLTPSGISRSMTRLEKRLGVALIRRTTRSLALTREGVAYRDRMQAILSDMFDLEASLSEAAQGPRGLLRINASPSFGVHCLIPILPRFAQAHPAITVDLTLTDQIVDLVEERADVAIRIGPLRDTRLRAKKLGRSAMALVASPDYLARRGTPATPDDLDAHDCLRFSFRRSIDSWPFLVDGRLIHKPIEGRFYGNSGEVVRQMAVAGCGIARHGRFHVADDLKAGRLVEVLRAYDAGDGEDIHALYAPEDRAAARIRALLDFLEAEMRIAG